MSGDIEYLRRLGVPVEEIARRCGRTTTAIENELRREQQRQEVGDVRR